MRSLEGIKWLVRTKVEKFTPEQVAWVERETGLIAPSGDILSAHVEPYETVETVGNALTTAGLTRLTALLTATGGTQALTNTSARIGVGNGTAAFGAAQTDLQGASKRFNVMEATYPQVSAGVVTAKSSFGDSDANFAWEEWCLDIGTPTVTSGATVNACMLNRKVANHGTKANGTWAFTVTITFS